DIGRLRQRVGGAAHPTPRWRRFSFRDGHGPAPAARWEAGLIEDDAGPSQGPWSALGLEAGASRSWPSPSPQGGPRIALITPDFWRRPRASPGARSRRRERRGAVPLRRPPPPPEGAPPLPFDYPGFLAQAASAAWAAP